MSMPLPPGWALNPNAPQWAYEVANPANQQPITAFSNWAAQPVVPPMPALVPPTYAQQQAAYPQAYQPPGMAPVHQHYGTPQQATGGMDVEAWLRQYQHDVRQAAGYEDREKNFVWIDFEKVPNKGDESIIHVRVIHDPIRVDQTGAVVPTSRHKVPIGFVPGAGGDTSRPFRMYSCYDQPDGPGDCPLCDVYADLAKLDNPELGGREGLLSYLKPDVSNAWQVILLDDPSKHWVQELDDKGQPVIDSANGQPRWKAVPGVIRIKKKLNEKLLTLIGQKGPFWDPNGRCQIGYPLTLIKKKTGPDAFNVEYDVIHGDSCPIDPSLYPIVQNAIDLRKEMRVFVEREFLAKMAKAMREKYLTAATNQQRTLPQGFGETWHPHPNAPGYEYNPATGATRPAAQMPPPPQMPRPPQPSLPSMGTPPGMMPPMPGAGFQAPGFQPPMPAPMQPPPFSTTQFPTIGSPTQFAPPPMPQGAPPPFQPPLGGARPLPPPGAPGLAGQPPMGFLAPPPPGMPPGVHPQAPPPPMPQGAPPAFAPPPGPPGGGLTPEQLEAMFQTQQQAPADPNAKPPPPF